ncbi:DoxX family protein [Aeromicrobium sp.]|uniref:DoxX family protein n=1 Tax=Aeromicrobium sp. TaxID=1871063 RepID=UPI003D6B62ED
MNVVTTVVVIVAAAWVGFSAYAIWTKKAFVVENISAYGVPERWWPWLGTAKALGAIGLLTGLFVPVIGIAAAVGLVLYFLGAVITVVRAHAYSHVPFPLLYLTPAVAAGWLIAAA